jgi:hypothetical protein
MRTTEPCTQHTSIPASFHSHCSRDPLKSRLVEDFVTPDAVSYSLPRSPRWSSRIMALNYTLRWLCDVVPVLSDHESDRYSAWELNDFFTGRQRSPPPRFEPFPQEVGQRLSSTASSSSILDTYHSPDMSYFALSTPSMQSTKTTRPCAIRDESQPQRYAFFSPRIRFIVSKM